MQTFRKISYNFHRIFTSARPRSKPGSTYETFLEQDIKRTISKAFEHHEYLNKFLRSKILEDNSGKAKRDFETF